MSDDVYTHANDVPTATREILYAYEVLRTIGVPVADIHTAYEKFAGGPQDGNVGVFVCVVKKGRVSLVIASVPTPMSETEASSAWEKAVALWNVAPNDKSVGWDVEKSTAREYVPEIIAALELSGFKYKYGLN